MNVDNLVMEDCKVPYEAIKLPGSAFNKVPKTTVFTGSDGFKKWFDNRQ